MSDKKKLTMQKTAEIFHLGVVRNLLVSLATVTIASTKEKAESRPSINKVINKRRIQWIPPGRVFSTTGHLWTYDLISSSGYVDMKRKTMDFTFKCMFHLRSKDERKARQPCELVNFFVLKKCLMTNSGKYSKT